MGKKWQVFIFIGLATLNWYVFFIFMKWKLLLDLSKDHVQITQHSICHSVQGNVSHPFCSNFSLSVILIMNDFFQRASPKTLLREKYNIRVYCCNAVLSIYGALTFAYVFICYVHHRTNWITQDHSSLYINKLFYFEFLSLCKGINEIVFILFVEFL